MVFQTPKNRSLRAAAAIAAAGLFLAVGGAVGGGETPTPANGSAVSPAGETTGRSAIDSARHGIAGWRNWDTADAVAGGRHFRGAVAGARHWDTADAVAGGRHFRGAVVHA